MKYLFRCGYPGCVKEFKVDCPVSEIFKHLGKEHDVDISNSFELLQASLYIKFSKEALDDAKVKT